jgi:beta-lactam-binding protein with PASTA domain
MEPNEPNKANRPIEPYRPATSAEEVADKQKKKRNLLWANSPLTLLIHLLLMAILGIGALLLFFYVFLPGTTNHSETITVPSLKGKSMEEVEEILKPLGLRFAVYDSSANNFTLEYPPYTTLDQSPAPNEKVKEMRTIYLTVNPAKPPMVKVPDLVEGSVKNAQIILKNYGLKLGRQEYVPDVASNAVLAVKFNNREIPRDALRAGYEVPKGSSIDLVVGDGMGNSRVTVPDVVGMPFDEAAQLLVGSGLSVGREYFQPGSAEPVGTVLKQYPSPEQRKTLRIGAVVDLWIAGAEGAVQ